MSNNSKEKYLSDEEVNALIKRIKNDGDNDAWDTLYKNYKKYVWSRVNELLDQAKYAESASWLSAKSTKIDLSWISNEELFQCGWMGFLDSLRAYKPEKGEFTTYATWYIDGEIKKGISKEFNPLGLTDKPTKGAGKYVGVVRFYDEYGMVDPYVEAMTAVEDDKFRYDSFEEKLNSIQLTEQGGYSPERRALQIIEVLRLITDENHTLTQERLSELLHTYRAGKYQNDAPFESENTMRRALNEIIAEIDPEKYSEENDNDYRVKYSGYKETTKEKGKKAPSITDLYYAHLFDEDTLNKLFQVISFSDFLSYEEKNDLASLLASQMSLYFKSDFWDGYMLRFNPKAIHGRLSRREMKDGKTISDSVRVIQEAINNMVQIRFKFNRYTADHGFVPKTDAWHTLSPYHMVIYHDYCYCIGLKGEDERIWHYRVDLMSDVEIRLDENGKKIPMRVSKFEGLPIHNIHWDPEKYMAEHMNMGFDEPRDILIKIPNDGYTMLHDWFGDHYQKTVKECEEGYDIVLVKCSPFMMVHWAMQYGDAVEVMDKELREQIRAEAERMVERYGR